MRIVPWAATASSYVGSVELIPGEPIASEDEGDDEGEGEAPGLKRAGLNGAGNAGGGGLGLLLLAGLGLGVLRRRLV